MATGGTALAWGGGVITPTVSAATVYPGTTGAVGSDISLALPNVAWNIGDTITEQITNTGNCTTAANTVGFNAAPTATASLASNAASTSTKPVVSVALSSSTGACTTAGVKDILTITFTNSGNNNGDANGAPTITLSPMKYNLGAGPITATNVALTATVAGAGTAPTLAVINDAAIANTKFLASKVVATTPSSTGVALGTLTASDVVAGTITSPITFTIAGATWNASATPKLTGPSGTTWTVARTSATVLTATGTGTIPTTSANTFALSGATIDTTGAAAVKVTAAFGAGPTTIGAQQTVAVAVAQPRLGGTDRYSTAAQMFNAAFSTATSVVVASGANFPDALSANYLASTLTPQTGVLLTDPNALPGVDVPILTNNHIATVYIVGGTAAVSQNVQNQIAALHVGNTPNGAFLQVIRVSGADRYATNNAVDLFNGAGGAGNTAVLATGENFADALSVGPAVYNKKLPLVLTTGGSLTASAQATLQNLGITNVVIAGGTSAVSGNVETQLKALNITVENRFAGADRTATAALVEAWEVATTATTVAATGYSGIAGLGFVWSANNGQAYVTRGDNFPDALAAGPLAGHGGTIGAVTYAVGPILLTGNATTLGAGIPTAFGGNAGNVGQVNTVGLTSAVSIATQQAAIASLS